MFLFQYTAKDKMDHSCFFFHNSEELFSLCSGPEVTKLFSCSNQLSTEFQLLIQTKIPINEEVSFSNKSLRCKLIMLINVKMPTIVGILTFMSRINFMLS